MAQLRYWAHEQGACAFTKKMARALLCRAAHLAAVSAYVGKSPRATVVLDIARRRELVVGYDDPVDVHAVQRTTRDLEATHPPLWVIKIDRFEEGGVRAGRGTEQGIVAAILQNYLKYLESRDALCGIRGADAKLNTPAQFHLGLVLGLGFGVRGGAYYDLHSQAVDMYIQIILFQTLPQGRRRLSASPSPPCQAHWRTHWRSLHHRTPCRPLWRLADDSNHTGRGGVVLGTVSGESLGRGSGGVRLE